MNFVLGAVVFGVGILVGAAIVQSTYNRVLNSNDKDDHGIR